MDGLRAWLDRRVPLGALLRLGREEEIPGGASFAYALGSATLFCFLLQVVTGVWQLFYYVPSVEHAYDSLMWMRTQVPFGWLLHGLHYWGANLMVVLVVCHLCRVFLWGAYKTPRELVWLSGVVLFLLTMGLSFTGAPLPWDERGYWAGEVGTSIAGSIPIVGPLSQEILRGGGTMGPLTLSRFFVLHAAILPVTLVGVIGLHLLAFRQFGSTGPWREESRRTTGPFWPDQVYKDLLVTTALFVLLVVLAAYAPAPIAGPADPLDSSYVPAPEWNFLFLYEALKFLPGRLEVLGTVGIPGLGLLVLLGLPFFDRDPERAPAKRPIALAGLVFGLGSVITLTVIAARGPSPDSVKAKAPSTDTRPDGSAKRSPSVVAGEKLFRSMGCIGCHAIGGVGGSVGPDLSQERAKGRTRAWITAQIHDPKLHDPGTVMPSFSALDAADTSALVDFLLGAGPAGTGAPIAARALEPATTSAASTAAPAAGVPAAAASAQASLPPPRASPGPPGPAAGILGDPDHGAVLFAQYCAGCHGESGRGGVPNPGSSAGQVPTLVPAAASLRDADPGVFAANLDRFVQHGATPDGPSPALHMPAFGDAASLTQAELADVEAYVMRANDVNRDAIAHPGIAPRRFAKLVAAAAAMLVAALAFGARRAGRGVSAAPPRA